MKIVILDGYTANPGDLSWEGLKELGEVTVYDRTKPSETVARASKRLNSKNSFRLRMSSRCTVRSPQTLTTLLIRRLSTG